MRVGSSSSRFQVAITIPTLAGLNSCLHWLGMLGCSSCTVVQDFHSNAEDFSVTAGCHSDATTALRSSSAADFSVTAESHGSAISAFKSLSKQHSDIAAQNEDPHPEEDKIRVQVALLGGGTCIVDTFLSAKVRDLKDAIQLKLGHSPYSQKLVLVETVLADSNATLGDAGVADATVLALILSREPIGQSSLETANGEKHFSLSDGSSLKDCLNEFELMSWEAAFEGGAKTWGDEERPNVGAWGLDLYWTTRSDGCRYEYWSSAPGDNEFGIFVRVDANEMSAIAVGDDDGIAEFEDFLEETPDYDTFTQLTKEGWPRPECWAEDRDEEE